MFLKFPSLDACLYMLVLLHCAYYTCESLDLHLEFALDSAKENETWE